MNQRIKELMLSKGLHKYIDSGCQARMEMLADLIIQDCIGIIEGGRFLHDEAPDAKFSRACSGAIKRHFGVEE